MTIDLPGFLVTAAALVGFASAPAAAQVQLLRLEGASAGAEFGTSLAMLGDVDGDGADDFAVGAPGEAGRQGVVRIHSGRTGAVLSTLAGDGPDDFFGQDVSAMDDVDGDGICELLVGAPEREIYDGDCAQPGGGFGTSYGPGYVRVISGASGAVLYTQPSPGGPFDVFGFKVTGGGDVDADGGADFLVPTGNSGRVMVYDGATGALIRTDDVTPYGSTYDVAVLGPVDGNAGDDYAVGWVEYSGCFSGGVRAFRGKSGTSFWSDFLCQPGDEYGFFVEGVGDLDGDGVRDVAACALDTGGFACSGFGYTRFLSGVTGSLLYASAGFKNGARGRAVADLGDLDGDGSDDLALGEPGLYPGSPGGQNLRIQNGLPGSPFFAIAPDDPGDGFGVAVASGDINGDGLRDVIVGARWDDDAGAQAGSVTVYTVWVGITNYCESQVNSQGCAPTIFATGMPSLTYNSLRVKAADVLNNKAGLLFWGTAPKQTPFGGGSGSLCVLAPVRRTPVQDSEGNPPPDDCSGTFSFHFNNPYVNQQGLTAGDQIFCQYWSRDPAGAGTTHLTDALVFTLEP